jgi:hypothetical protein
MNIPQTKDEFPATQTGSWSMCISEMLWVCLLCVCFSQNAKTSYSTNIHISIRILLLKYTLWNLNSLILLRAK